VTIAPINPDPVGAYEGDTGGPDIRGNGGGVEQWPAAHLLDASGAGTGQAEGTRRIESLMGSLLPFDEDSVVAAIDGVGDHERKIKRPPGVEGLPACDYKI
jgi:hypothetical protein